MEPQKIIFFRQKIPGGQKNYFFGPQNFLKAKKLFFRASKIFGRQKNIFFQPQNFLSPKKIIFSGSMVFLLQKNNFHGFREIFYSRERDKQAYRKF